MTQAQAPLLDVRDIHVIYGQVIIGLRGVSLRVAPGEVVALLGANGAGKSTTLKAISGLLRAERGEVVQGSIHYRETPISARTPRDLVAAGLVQVLEGRHCFPQLTVEENLVTGTLLQSTSRAQTSQAIERIYGYFPRLKLLRKKQAGYASGGEQQMLAIGRALISRPKLILLDEPSMGLAPLIVDEIFQIVRELNAREGVSFLLAEQNATVALAFANHGYILENGKVVVDDSAENLRARDDVKQFYLGVGEQGRKSFRQPRHARSPDRKALSAPIIPLSASPYTDTKVTE